MASQPRVCPRCGYTLQPLETSCSRCTGVAAPASSVTPPPHTAPAESTPSPRRIVLGLHITFWNYLLRDLLLPYMGLLLILLILLFFARLGHAATPTKSGTLNVCALLATLLTVPLLLVTASIYLWLHRATLLLGSVAPRRMSLSTLVESRSEMDQVEGNRWNYSLWAMLETRNTSTTCKIYWPPFALSRQTTLLTLFSLNLSTLFRKPYDRQTWQNRRRVVNVYEDTAAGGPIVIQDDDGTLLCAHCPLGYPLRSLE